MLPSAARRGGAPLMFLSLILLLSSLVGLGDAASPTSFCKCTCFGAYRIIPLDAAPDPDDPTSSISQRSLHHLLLSRADLDSDPSSSLSSTSASTSSSSASSDSKPDPDSDPDSDPKEYRAKTCNDCNRSFCLAQNLPECRDAADGDVFATCFQRDSSKDEAVVFVFLLTTVALLGWALLKPLVERVRSRGDGMGRGGGWGYLLVAMGGGNAGGSGGNGPGRR